MRKSSEANALTYEIIAWLFEQGAPLAWRQNTGAVKVKGALIRYGYPSCADVLGMWKDGRLISIEVKGPTDAPTVGQIDNKNHIKTNNGLACIAYSLDDVKKMFKEAGIA